MVWRGMTLPGVLRALGGPEVPPLTGSEYDRFYILTMVDDATKSKPRFTALRYCDRTN